MPSTMRALADGAVIVEAVRAELDRDDARRLAEEDGGQQVGAGEDGAEAREDGEDDAADEHRQRLLADAERHRLLEHGVLPKDRLAEDAAEDKVDEAFRLWEEARDNE